MSNTTIKQNIGKITVYACGGAGINIGSQLKDSVVNSDENSCFADIEVVYIDTSRTNLSGRHLSEDEYFLIPRTDTTIGEETELDGSGQERDKNLKYIVPAVPKILTKHKPGDLAIVVSSGSGGSGSTTANVLSAELKKRDVMTISIVVGSRDTVTDISNTISTLKTYWLQTEKTNKDSVLFYIENGERKEDGTYRTIKEVDYEIIKTITSIAVLFSRQNTGLDLQDLINFLNVSGIKRLNREPTMVSISIVDRQEAILFPDNIVAAASLSDNSMDTTIEGKTLSYQCRGVLPERLTQASNNGPRKLPYHYLLSDTAIMQRYLSLDEELKTIMDRSTVSATAAVKINLSKDDDMSDYDVVI